MVHETNLNCGSRLTIHWVSLISTNGWTERVNKTVDIKGTVVICISLCAISFHALVGAEWSAPSCQEWEGTVHSAPPGQL